MAQKENFIKTILWDLDENGISILVGSSSEYKLNILYKCYL